MSGCLYVVGTPIGNLSDLSPRGAETLAAVDFIAAEDTRVTRKLLTRFDIDASLVSYHEHNRAEMGEVIVDRLLAGESCALVTDAGMPAISDPGTELVDACRRAGVPVVSVPGPSAVVTALALSGMDSSRFTFEGFLSVSNSVRRKRLEELSGEKRTMVFYEAPHKLTRTLADLSAAFGPDRPVALCREMTKIHEEVERTTLGEAAEKYAQTAPRGEFVLVVAGRPDEPAREYSLADAVALAKTYVGSGAGTAEAAKRAAAETGLKKSDIYRELCQDF